MERQTPLTYFLKIGKMHIVTRKIGRINRVSSESDMNELTSGPEVRSMEIPGVNYRCKTCGMKSIGKT